MTTPEIHLLLKNLRKARVPDTKLQRTFNPHLFPKSSLVINSRLCFPFAVVTQYYESEVVSEYVIRGNAAVLKCNIPSFVSDFVKVEAWIDTDGGEYLHTDNIGIQLHNM